MGTDLDFVARFAKAKNFDIRTRTVFVEGTSDVGLFYHAAKLAKEVKGVDLLGNELAIVASGEGNDGGAAGVCRELITFKNLAKYCLLPDGQPKYRFLGLLDYDNAGRRALTNLLRTDTDALEYKDIIFLRPAMPHSPNRDPHALRTLFERCNTKYRQLDWELEDLVSETLVTYLLDEFPYVLKKAIPVDDKVHREWTPDGKARLHQIVKKHAIYSDIEAVVHALRALCFYLGVRILE